MWVSAGHLHNKMNTTKEKLTKKRDFNKTHKNTEKTRKKLHKNKKI